MALTRPRLGQFDTTVSSLSDPITVIHGGATSANVDVGFLMNRANGLVSNVALYWNEAGNAFVTAFTSNTGLTDSNIAITSYANLVTNSITVNGAILPSANIAYDLGSPTQRFRTLYISGNTIDIGGHTISTASGQITFNTPAGGLVAGAFSTLSANANTSSTSTSTGTMIVTGGAGISGDVNIGGNLRVNGIVTFTNTVVETSTELVQGVEIVAGNLVANSGTASTTTTTGALVVAGGAGVSGAVNIGTSITVAGVNLVSNVSNLQNQITGANASIVTTNSAIVTANSAVVGYVNDQVTTINTNWQANSAGQTNQITGANAAIVTANTALKSYTDDQITTANTGLKSYVDSQVTTLNTSISGVTTAWTANAAGQANQITGANAAIVTANTAIKSYVDAQILNGALTTAAQPNVTRLGTLTGLTSSGVVNISNTTVATNTVTGAFQVLGGAGIQGSLYAGAVYDNANRVLSTTTGSGNLLISGTQVTLPATGPGAITVGSSTSIPVVTTDAYGRVVALTGASISTTLNLAGTSGTGAVALGSQTFTFASTNGVVATASGTTVTLATAQDIRTTATPTFAGLTSTANTAINSTLYINGVTRVTNSTASSGAGNGALVVTGGAGVSGTSYFGGDLYVTGNIFTPNLVATNATTLNTSSPMVYFQATPYPYNFETGFYSHFIGGPANVYAHTGFVRNHNNNVWTLFSNVASEPSSTTINFADAGLIYDTLQLGGIIISNTTTSTSTTSGALVVSGGVGIGGNLNVNNAAYIGYNAINTTLTNPTIVATSSSNSVNAGQFYVQNALLNSSGSGSADFIAYGNNYPGSNNDHGWMDMGFTGNSFSDPAYGITKSNDGYLFASAVSGTSLGGNLVLATDNTGTYNDIVFATGSFAANAEVARFHGNATTAGYLQITTGTTSTSTATGALRISGGIGITGNVYSDKLFVTNGIYWAGNNNVISSGGGGSAPAGVSGQVQYNDGGVLGATPLYNYVANAAIVVTNTTAASSTSTGAFQVSGGTGITGAMYAGSVFDNGVRVLSTSTGVGNLSISGTQVTLPATGPGAVTVGSSTSIPVITTDAYGRIATLTSSAVSTTISLAGTGGTGSVAGGDTLTLSGSNGITTSVSSSTITISAGTIPTSNVSLYDSVTALTTNQTFYPQFSNISTTGNSITGVASNFTFNPSTGTLGATVVNATTLTGTLSTASQTSITGVGTITTGTWSGLFGAVSGANLTSLTAGNLSGTIPSAVLGNSTHYIGTTAITLNRASASQSLTGVSIDGSAGSATTATTATNQSGGTIAATTGTFSGNVTRSSRPLITNFTGNIAPASPIQGDEWWYDAGNTLYKYIYNGTGYSWVNITPSLFNANTGAVASTLALRDSGGSLTATTFIGKATSAQYADLAENYVSDYPYEPGTVVVFGGEQEITTTNKSHDSRVAGVISTDPAYLMNSECAGLPVAFTGRVPCQVQGPVTKGQLLVTSNKPGVAHAIDNTQFVPGCVIGKSLENITTNEITTIEVVVGRF